MIEVTEQSLIYTMKTSEVARVVNTEENIEVCVIENLQKDKFCLRIKDLDSGLCLPTMPYFNYYKDALEEAKRICAGEESYILYTF